MTLTPVPALQGALAAEHAAIYGYGVAGARLAGSAQQTALRYWNGHQKSRDALVAMISRFGVAPVAAQAAYQLPFPVRDVSSARELAALLEEGVTRAYLGLVGVSDATICGFGARQMQAPAERAAYWRGGTTAFPGMPPRSA